MSAGLFADKEGESLPLVDADLRLWSRVDLGADREQVLRRLLNECAWQQQEITLYGKTHLQPRLSAWYGERGYRYSGIDHRPRPWTPLLQSLRRRVEAITGHRFNSVLLNYYRDHRDRMGMHSDDERALGERPAIASLSLGETRRLVLRHRTRKDLETLRLPLDCGSLLLMQGDTQANWRHGIDAERGPGGARVNLTFRRIVTPPA